MPQTIYRFEEKRNDTDRIILWSWITPLENGDSEWRIGNAEFKSSVDMKVEDAVRTVLVSISPFDALIFYQMQFDFRDERDPNKLQEHSDSMIEMSESLVENYELAT